jgi:CHAT domain-containing protein/Tfp pilus assembly protein PilF
MRSLAFLSVFLLGSPLVGQSIDRAIDLHTSGRLREALTEYRAVAKATEASDPPMAATAFNNACVILMDLGDYRTALPDCRSALRLLEAEDDPESLSRAHNNLGLVLQVLGEPIEAEQRFHEALALNRRTGDAEAQVINLSNLGALAVSGGRYSTAMALHAEAAALAAKHGDSAWAAEQIRVARMNQGVVLEKVGAYREALDLYKSLLAEDVDVDAGRRAALLVNTGVLYRNLGDPVRALDAFREAMVDYERAGDTAGLSNAWLNLGLAMHLNLERPAEAEAAYREALRLAEASGDRTEEIQDLFYLGRLLFEQGKLQESAAVYRRCLEVADKSDSAEGRWSAREGLGRIARARGDLRGALGQLERAIAEIERVRAAIVRGSRRAGYFGDKRTVYAAAVEMLAELQRREPGKRWGERALEVVQQAKARDLLDALGSGRRPSAPLRAAALQARAEKGTVLEYFLGETHLYLWVIRENAIHVHDLGPRGPLLDAVARVHRDLSRGSAPDPAAVAALSRKLLKPADLSPEDAPLRIAPDGALHYLPFELLDDPLASGVPLVERLTVSYLPSASTMSSRREGGPSAPLRLLGFGNPSQPRDGGTPPAPAELLVERFALAPLPATERELEVIGQQLGGARSMLTAGRATEGAFRAAVARGARVVHLATHTVIDERSGRGAAILLTAAGNDDGLLTPEEIASLDDRSDLTVLAACRTALASGGESGQALTSLIGSFLAAGSRAVVATLWDVGDAETAIFMEQLYYELGRGQAPAEALRAAKRRLRSDPRWSRPGLWAGYVLVGEAPPVVPRRPWALWLAGGFALGLLSLAMLRRGSRGNG